MGTRELWLNVVRPWQDRRKLSEAPPPPVALPQPIKRLKSRN
jgi:hypothetical protein